METQKIIEKIYDQLNVNNIRSRIFALNGLLVANKEVINNFENIVAELDRQIQDLDKRIENLRIEILASASDNFDFRLEQKRGIEEYYYGEMQNAIREYKVYSHRRILFKNNAKLLQLDNVQASKVLQYNNFIANKEDFIKTYNKKVEAFNISVNKCEINLANFKYQLFDQEKLEILAGLIYLKNEKIDEFVDKKISINMIDLENKKIYTNLNVIEKQLDELLSEREDLRLLVGLTIDKTIEKGIKLGNKLFDITAGNLKSVSEIALILGRNVFEKINSEEDNFISVNENIVEENNLKNSNPEIKEDLKKLVKKLEEKNNSKK